MIGGLAYELTGIVASLVKPGHDGKLYVSALAPLVFLALLKAIRERRPWGYALLALVVGLCMLSPHYQMTYYLLVAAGLWTLWLVFLDPDRPAGTRWPVALGSAFGAVLLGVAISAIQVLPFLSYIPFSPRGEGGPSGGWDYAVVILDAAGGDPHDGPAPIQRRLAALLGTELLQAAHGVSGGDRRRPRRARVSPTVPGARW